MLTFRLLLTIVVVANMHVASADAARYTSSDWEMNSCRRPASNGYTCYGTWDGVSFFFRLKQPQGPGDKAEGLLGAYNARADRVWVSYTPVWTCADGSVRESSSQGDTFRPGQTQSGEFSGMWYYPCPDGVRISTVRLRARVRPE